MFPDQYNFQTVIHDFQSARKKAGIQEVLARITGKSTQLLSYEEVAEKFKLRVRTERGVQYIPLNAIVGSVGRYTDFTRTFLPRRDKDQERWARVKTVFMESGAGLPPIEVYKVGEAYFVVDGNHRVSIARQEGLTSIEAHVIEFKTDIPLTPNVQPDDLIIKAEYVEFLDATHIHRSTSQCGLERHLLLSIREIDGPDPRLPIYIAGGTQTGCSASGRRRKLVRHNLHSPRRSHS